MEGRHLELDKLSRRIPMKNLIVFLPHWQVRPRVDNPWICTTVEVDLAEVARTIAAAAITNPILSSTVYLSSVHTAYVRLVSTATKGNVYNLDKLLMIIMMVREARLKEARSWNVASSRATYGVLGVDNQLRQLCLVLPWHNPNSSTFCQQNSLYPQRYRKSGFLTGLMGQTE